MKTTLLTLFSAFIFSIQASSQIVIAYSSFPSVISGTDSASIANGNIGAIAIGANATWDLTGITYNILDSPYVMHATDTPNYTYYDEGIHYVSPYLYFHVRNYFNITNPAFAQPGKHVYTAYYPLYGIIAGAMAHDSLNFHGQDDIFSFPLTKINFNASSGSNWSSTCLSSVVFSLSYAGLYNNAPGLYKQYITEYDSVVGWGKMKVKQANNSASNFMDVLQVKVINHQTDSFFISGSKASDTLLSAFGLVQGSNKSTYEYRFYRLNEVTPLADIVFADSTFSNTGVAHTIIHMQRLAQPDNKVNSLITASELNIYPNPVTNHSLFVDVISGNKGNLSYDLINALGQIVNKGSFSTGSGKTSIQIPAQIGAGQYYIKINDGSGNIFVKPLLIFN